MQTYNPIRQTVAAMLAATFALASTAALAMSPSEHDTMPREERKSVSGQDEASRSERDSRHLELKNVDGKVGVIEVRSRVD